jgi:hypoxia-inducible factor prolyl 4-hydroxylase
VQYPRGGHYNAHYDSSDTVENAPECCTRYKKTAQCRSCRYATVLFYLNTVEEGGETAFPIADEMEMDFEVVSEGGNTGRAPCFMSMGIHLFAGV